MNPISQIELNAHFKGLEKQMATARGSQGAAFYWLRMLWRNRRSEGPKESKASTSRHPAPAR